MAVTGQRIEVAKLSERHLDHQDILSVRSTKSTLPDGQRRLDWLQFRSRSIRIRPWMIKPNARSRARADTGIATGGRMRSTFRFFTAIQIYPTLWVGRSTTPR